MVSLSSSEPQLKLRGNVPGGQYNKTMVLEKFMYWGNRCWLCHKEGVMTRDHVKPRGKGGLDILANIRPACRSCNSKKMDTWPYPG